MKKPTNEQLTLNAREFELLVQIGGFSEEPVDGQTKITFHLGNLAVNHICAKIDSELYVELEALLERNLIKSAGLESKTQLRRLKVDIAEVGQWHSYYIGGGTFGRAAQQKFFHKYWR